MEDFGLENEGFSGAVDDGMSGDHYISSKSMFIL